MMKTSMPNASFEPATWLHQKHEGGKKIMAAIRRVLSGQISVSENMSAKILEIFSGRRAEAALHRLKISPIASSRFFGTWRGLTTKETAGQMRISAKNGRGSPDECQAKLNLKTMAELIRYAVRWVESQSPER